MVFAKRNVTAEFFVKLSWASETSEWVSYISHFYFFATALHSELL